jgi:hypothetical protein
MTFMLHDTTEITVTGIHTSKNHKPVLCIDTGEVFASISDAAEANGVHVTAISCVVLGKTKTCKGKRFCLVTRLADHTDEIAEALRSNLAKATKYDAILAEEARIKAEQERKVRMAKELEELKAQRTEFLHETKRKLTETDEAIKALEEALNA